MKNMTIEDIAKVCHEANRAFCETQNDMSQLSWSAAADWQRTSAIASVQFQLDHPDALPGAQHQAWLDSKVADGWKPGPIKDAEKKEHPCIVPFTSLSADQQAKDHLFIAVVDSLKHFLSSPVFALATLKLFLIVTPANRDEKLSDIRDALNSISGVSVHRLFNLTPMADPTIASCEVNLALTGNTLDIEQLSIRIVSALNRGVSGMGGCALENLVWHADEKGNSVDVKPSLKGLPIVVELPAAKTMWGVSFNGPNPAKDEDWIEVASEQDAYKLRAAVLNLIGRIVITGK